MGIEQTNKKNDFMLSTSQNFQINISILQPNNGCCTVISSYRYRIRIYRQLNYSKIQIWKMNPHRDREKHFAVKFHLLI